MGKLDSASAARVIAAAGDVVLLVDDHGMIRDLAVNSDDMARDGAGSWLDQRWSDTVTLDSRHKVADLLRDAKRDGRSAWRELNQITPGSNAMMMRYLALDGGRDGWIVAIGRDDRATSVMQARLQETQQVMERDYVRLRDAEARYRLLLETAGEAVLVVDAASKRILEANPAALRLMGESNAKLVGEPLARIFDAESREDAAHVLAVAQSTTGSACTRTRLKIQGRDVLALAWFFREGRVARCLVRLEAATRSPVDLAETQSAVQALLERLPDPLVITDGGLKIVSVNTGFLDLVRLSTPERAIGRPLDDFLGRAGLERGILLEALRDHGSVRNLATVLRNQLGESEDVEVSALSAPDGAQTRFSFTIRGVRRPPADRAVGARDSRRSVEQLTALVGRVKLKELVRESSDLVEKLCIEAALDLTRNNRAAAAGLLGLSRQSLYSKINRFGLGALPDA